MKSKQERKDIALKEYYKIRDSALKEYEKKCQEIDNETTEEN